MLNSIYSHSMLVSIITIIYSLVVVSVLVVTLRKSLRAKSIQESVATWALFGFIINILSASTYYVTLPIVGVSSALTFFLITVVVLLISVTCSMLYSFVGVINFTFTNKYLLKLFAVSAAVIFVEIVRSYVLTLLLWGGGSALGAHMSSWTFGEVLASSPLVSFAYIGGVFILAGVLVFCIGLFVYPLKKFVKIGLCVAVVAVSIFIGESPKPLDVVKPITVAIVQTSFPRIDDSKDRNIVFRERHNAMRPLIMSLASSTPDIIVLPEDSRFITSQSVKESEELSIVFPDTVFIDGTTRKTSDGRKNTSVLFDSKTNETVLRDKGFLFPFGEYVPYIVQPIIELFAGTKLVTAYQSVHEYTAGVLPRSQQTRFGKVGILICSEINSFTSVHSLRTTNPDIVFLQSSLAWGHNNPYLTMEYVFSAKIAAAMLKKPVITVVNYGPSFIVNSSGGTLFFKESQLSVAVFRVEGNAIRQLK